MGDIKETLKKINATIRAEAKKNHHLKAYLELKQASSNASITIREARQRSGMTQTELAEEVGTTQSVISRLEDAGYEGHTMKMLERVASALGHSIEIRLKPKNFEFQWAPPTGKMLPSRN